MKTGLYRRRTKIVATIGPATGSASVITRLIRAGMNVARLNLSHGSHEMHAHYIQTIRRISEHLGMRVAILMDLPGPKYRTGKLKGGQAVLKRGALIALTTQEIEGDATLVPVSLPNLPQDVKIGDTILLDDGALQLRVLGTADDEVKCRVTVGGVLTEDRGLVVPGMHNSVPFITEALRQHILFAITQQPDYIALSFVSSADDVAGARAILRENHVEIPIISKIERGDAVRKFDRILKASDGIMVARGDLGVDIPLERVPLAQKEIIRKSNQAGKPVITATQMLESMIHAARPTRAEVTDVANAILDGTDATMLSAETSIGSYPVLAVKTMAKIAEAAETRLPYELLMSERGGKWIEHETDELISYSACYTAYRLGASAIVAFTHSGSTARRVAKYRPPVPILAITPSAAVCGQLLLHWGVSPMQIPSVASVDGLFTTGAGLARELGMAKKGDLIVITGGVPVGVAGSTNMLKVEKIA
ncbi:MAG: pyruvate kinase [Dehalococcoidales bacterium]|nr:pyruvate kinase [Dehalococcoidales bacterium]